MRGRTLAVKAGRLQLQRSIRRSPVSDARCASGNISPNLRTSQSRALSSGCLCSRSVCFSVRCSDHHCGAQWPLRGVRSASGPFPLCRPEARDVCSCVLAMGYIDGDKEASVETVVH